MRIIICAAGTGGHINPAIAIANKIKEKEPNSKIVFIGTNRGLENDLVPRAGYELKTIEAYGLKKEISIRNIIHIIKTIKSSKDVKKIIDEFKPDLVLGTGGYICGPVISSAISRRIPTVLHESNAYPGRAVKMFAKDVNLLLTGFQETKNRLKDCKKIVVTGTPTKIKKVRIDENRKKEILKEFGIKNDLPIVLIFGGSQGAKAINDAVFNLIIKKLNKDYQIIWVAGTKQYDIIKESFEKENIYINHLTNVKVLPYIYNMEEIMNISDLLVARSGAMTITEVSIVGKPAIFIPLPSKSANRQEDNARVLEKIGAAKIILNKDLNEEKLSLEINDIIFNKSELEEMGNLANRFAPSNVEEKIYLEIKKMLEELKNNNDR